MKRSNLSLVFFLILFSSCTDYGVSRTSAFISNLTGLDAELEFYYEGKIFTPVNYTKLINNKNNLVSKESSRGKNIAYNFADIYGTFDSVIIKFSNGRKLIYSGVEVQNRVNKICKNSDCIILDDPRSILNLDNYSKLITEESRRKQNTEFTFTLTIENYLKAGSVILTVSGSKLMLLKYFSVL